MRTRRRGAQQGADSSLVCDPTKAVPGASVGAALSPLRPTVEPAYGKGDLEAISGAGCPTHFRKPGETWRNDLKQPTDAKGLPGSGYGIEVDGLLKSEFVTIEGATNGARELKTRFPMLQIRIYDAVAKTRTEVTA